MQSVTLADVLIIGAGISGIGAACHLTRRGKGARFVILESRDDLGGTWDLFRYPGVRSDSDLFTFGYDFRPWDGGRALADGPSIKAYLAETVREYGVDRHIRYRHRVTGARWSSKTARWRVTAERRDTGETVEFEAKWVFSATGYYRYDEGFTPEFAGRDRFRGPIVHPQRWPEDLDYSGKRVVIVGSGATAVTLVPAMAETAAHVVMLQRTPTYVLPVPEHDPWAPRLRRLLGRDRAHRFIRHKNILRQRLVYQFCQKFPGLARSAIRYINKRMLPPGYPVDVHFNPTYGPWDQRLCAVPGGDLFRAIKEGKASVVTDHIRTFTETGIELESGASLDADIIVTATGLNLLPLGGIGLEVDGEPVRIQERVTFKGMLLSGIPNYALAIGYTASSWTLKVGLLCEHFCRLLDYMEAEKLDICVPQADPDMPTRPFLDFGAGYVRRSIATLPRQGDRSPWVMGWNYFADVKILRKGVVDDPNLQFSSIAKG
jgi:monooxygenase